MFLMGLSGYLAYSQMAASLEGALVDNMEGEASALTRAISDLATTSIENIARMADHEAVHALFARGANHAERLEQATAVLKRLEASYSGFNRITVLDTKGLVVATSRPELTKIGESFADRNYFKSAIGGTPFLATPFLSRVINRAIMAASVPIREKGAIIGVAYATMDLDPFFNAFIAPVKVGQRGFAYIVNDQGLVVLAKNTDWLFKEDLPAVAEYKKWMTTKKEGSAQFRGNGGAEVLAYHKTEPISKLTAVIQAETQDVFSGLYAMRKTTYIIVFCSILAGSLLVILIIRPVVTSLNKGVRFAQQVATGDLNGQLTVYRKDEIGKLADALRQIPDSLRR